MSKRPIEKNLSQDTDTDIDIDITEDSPIIQTRKKARTVELEEFNPTEMELQQQLEIFGNNIALLSEAEAMPSEEALRRFEELQTQFNVIFKQAFDETMKEVAIRQQKKEIATTTEMAAMEAEQIQELRKNFLRKLQVISTNMAEELTYGQQVKMYEYIVNIMNRSLDSYRETNSDEPNHLARLAELSSIIYIYTLSQLSIILSNIYQKGPEIIQQIIAIIGASGLAYNYLPPNIRGSFESIRIFGPLFQMMNTVNPQALLVQHSATSVVSIFYLLKNAGIDTSPTIRYLANMTKEVATTAVASAASALVDTTSSCVYQGKRLVCSGAQIVIGGIADRLGTLLTSEYQDINYVTESQASDVSSSSISSISSKSMSSRRSVDVNSIPSSEQSRQSLANSKGVIELFTIPEEDGGIDLSGINEELVDSRFRAIQSLVTGEAVSPVANNSQTSVLSGISDLSDDTVPWHVWLFGPKTKPIGGKRNKKSRRHIKLRKSRRFKKGKRHMTKKGKRHNRTVKRYVKRYKAKRH